jgi:8-oxo-dGTP pyrophosphatase MutT (NUDIX family)
MAEPTWLPEPDADQTLHANWLFRLRRERFRSRASGRAHDFFVMELADCVNVIAVTPDQEVVLVRQFRAGSRADSLETPGGLVEPGEDPLVAGPRELREETGYAGGPPRRIGTVWSNPSILTSRATTILVPEARRVVEPRPDESEELTIERAPVRDIPAMIGDGRISHSLVVAGLLWWLAGEGASPGATSSVSERIRNVPGRVSG